MRESLQILANNSNVIKECQKLSSDSTHLLVFETSQKKCQCGASLKRNYKNRNHCKGAQIVCFDNIVMPKYGVSYSKHCSICQSTYYYGFKINQNLKVSYVPLENNIYFQANKYTFYNKNIFDEVEMWMMDDGVGFYSCAEKLNARFDDKNKSKQRTYGKRISLNITGEMLNTAFCMYKLQEVVENRLKKRFIVEGDVFIDRYCNNSKIHFSNKIIRENIITRNKNLFNYMFDKYGNEIAILSSKYITEVPFKNGELMPGCLCVYGDGNCKINRQVCMYPQKLLEKHGAESRTSGVYNNIKCSNSQQQAGKNACLIRCCVQHQTVLMKHGLHATKINDYLDYMDILYQLGNSTQRNKKSKDELHSALLRYRLDIKVFTQVTANIENPKLTTVLNEAPSLESIETSKTS